MLAARARLGPATAAAPRAHCATRRPPSVLLARAAAPADASSTAHADAVWPTPSAGDPAAPLLARVCALGPVALDADDGTPIDDLSALLRPTSPAERVAFIALSHFGDLVASFLESF